MEKHELHLASSMMDLAASEFSHHGCNDMDHVLTLSWTHDQRLAFVREYGVWNGDPENWQTIKDFEHLPDFAIMGFLAHKLKQESSMTTPRERDPRKRLSEKELAAYRTILKGADEVIIAHHVPLVDFDKQFKRDGKLVVYFGTKESFEEWRIKNAN